jgi:hypothetical protein
MRTDEKNVDAPARSSPSAKEQEAAAAVVDVVARRADLRERASAALSRKLSKTDIAMCVGIGLLGALPKSPKDFEKAPETMKQLVTGARDVVTALNGPAVGAVLTAALTDGSATPNIAAAVGEMTAHVGGVGWLGALLASAPTGPVAGGLAALIPDGKDVFESIETRVLTDLLCKYRNWSQDDQVYHEAKALAYAVNAVVGAHFNPDPIAFAMAAWHGYKALRASAQLTTTLVELGRLAVEEGARLDGEYDAEVHRSRVVDALCASDLAAPHDWGAEDRERADSAFLNALGAPAVRGRN